MDIFEKCYSYGAVEAAKAAGVYPYFYAMDSEQSSEVLINGRRTIMLGSNNYLGLTYDTRVKKAAQGAIKKYGTGCSGSRFLNGTLDLHLELEEELASFLKKDAVLAFSTGFQTNLGLLSAIAGRNDYIICDKENHASLVDGCRLSFGKVVKYKHNDMEDLERALVNVPGNKGKLIVTDGVFSMGGDLCNLPEIVRLAERYGARIMVDDAHGIGVMGANGRGTAEHFGLEDKVDVVSGTFSKSFASLGGFIAAEKQVVEFVKHTSRPFVFSASISPGNTAAALEALRVLKNEPWRVVRLRENAEYMRKGLIELGLSVGKSVTPIIPVMTWEDERTFLLFQKLFEEGVYTNPVVSPGVAQGEALLRTSYTATHTKEQLDYALGIFDKVFNEK